VRSTSAIATVLARFAELADVHAGIDAAAVWSIDALLEVDNAFVSAVFTIFDTTPASSFELSNAEQYAVGTHRAARLPRGEDFDDEATMSGSLRRHGLKPTGHLDVVAIDISGSHRTPTAGSRRPPAGRCLLSSAGTGQADQRDPPSTQHLPTGSTPRTPADEFEYLRHAPASRRRLDPEARCRWVTSDRRPYKSIGAAPIADGGDRHAAEGDQEEPSEGLTAPDRPRHGGDGGLEQDPCAATSHDPAEPETQQVGGDPGSDH